MNRSSHTGRAAVASLLLAAGTIGGATAAAGSSVSPHSRVPMTPVSRATKADPTNTPAAQLYAALDELLREHADLTASVVESAVATGASSPETKGALSALGQNTDDLGAAFGSLYGSAAKTEFLKLWRAHIGYFVDYTLGLATRKPAEVATAQKDLAGYVSSFSQFVSGATKLPRSAVAADLRGHVSTLESAITAIVGKSATAGSMIQMAAAHMDGTAQVLAEGIVSSKGISGAVTSPASKLRSALTGLLVQHVADTGFVVQTAIADGGNLNAPEVKGAIGALATNTDELGAAIGSIYGKAAQAEFLKLWRAHIGFFVSYTLGVATKKASMVAAAQRNLDGYVSSFSTFIAGATELPASAVAADLRGHISTLEAAIDAIVARRGDTGSTLLMAESHMAGTAAVLASGIVAAVPSKFGS